MDEILDIIDLLSDFGLEGVFVWLLRAVGFVSAVVGIGLWLLTDMEFLFVPAALVVAGIVLMAVPELMLWLTEFA